MPAPLWYALASLWTLAIVIGCLLPGGSLPDATLWSFDKLIHFGIFAGFGGLWMEAMKQPVGRRAMWVALGGIFFAAATELLQGFAPGRSPELFDLLADVVGLAVGIAVYALVRRRALVRT